MVYGSVAGEVRLWWGHSRHPLAHLLLSVLCHHSGSLAPSCCAAGLQGRAHCHHGNPGIMTPSGERAGTCGYEGYPSGLGSTAAGESGEEGAKARAYSEGMAMQQRAGLGDFSLLGQVTLSVSEEGRSHMFICSFVSTDRVLTLDQSLSFGLEGPRPLPIF